MTKQTVFYLHGFASSGQGAKAQYFRSKFEPLPGVTFHAFEFNPTPTDFQYMTITGLINRLRQYLLEFPAEGLSFIGSSLGALVALHYAQRFGGVQRMLLLAPALHYNSRQLAEVERQQWAQTNARPIFHYAFKQEIPLPYAHYLDGLNYPEPITPTVPTLIIHGRADTVVSIAGSRQYTAEFPDKVELVEVDSDHRLSDQHDLIWHYVRAWLCSD